MAKLAHTDLLLMQITPNARHTGYSVRHPLISNGSVYLFWTDYTGISPVSGDNATNLIVTSIHVRAAEC